MSLTDNYNTLAEKALLSYVKTIDFTILSGIEAVELMQSYINNGDYTNAQIVVDYYLANGLPFDRANIIPSGIVYANGIVPSIQLKFIDILNKIYKYTQVENYNTQAQNFLNILNNKNMIVNSGKYNTEPLSTAVLIFDIYGTIIPNYKSGTYVSDLNPYAEYIYGNNISQTINCLFDAQKQFKIDYNASTYGLFSPFYIRNLLENASYGTANTFIFGGPLGNENDLYHQYEIGLNLAKYYYGRYKQNSDRDIKAKTILEKYFQFITTSNYPSSISLSVINTDSSDITTDDSWVNTDTLDSFLLSGTADLGNLARLGMSTVYKYKIDLEDITYNLATTLYNQIIALQQADGSIYEATINPLNQFLALQFIALYNKINYKTWYDIINSALKLYQIPEINDNNASTHEENYVFEMCRIGLDDIFNNRFFNFAYTNTTLPWVTGQYSWHLPDYNINMHKIGVVDFRITQPGKLYEPILMSFPQWKIFFDASPGLTGLPLRYSINPGTSINPNQLPFQNEGVNETLYVFPTPDHDYEINVVSYKLEPYINDFNQYPTYLPPQWYQVLKYFIAYKIGINRGSPLAEYWQIKYSQSLSILEVWDANGNFSSREMPTNFSYGRRGLSLHHLSPYIPFEGVS